MYGNSKIYSKNIIHGLNHAIKTGLFALIIGESINLEENEKLILLDAALLHDIGRIDNYFEEKHGYFGAILATIVLSDIPFYNDDKNFWLVQALIECHCIKEEKFAAIEDIRKKYHILEEENFFLLLKILKDADILDRIRLGEIIEEVDLNLASSRKLLKLSLDLNTSLYYSSFKR